MASDDIIIFKTDKKVDGKPLEKVTIVTAWCCFMHIQCKGVIIEC